MHRRRGRVYAKASIAALLSLTAAASLRPTLSRRATTDLPPILFESDRSGRYELHAINRAGNDLVQVTASSTSLSEAQNEGSGSAFSSDRDGDGAWLQVRSPNGQSAWIARSLVSVQGDLANVAVSA